MTMAKRLSDRSDYLSTFAAHVTHELKTPLTSIRGAAELILDAGEKMPPEARQRFLANVMADSERMNALLDRLRELARADNPALGGVTSLGAVADELRARFTSLNIVLEADPETPIAMSLENALIVFGNLFDNANHHSAHRVRLAAGQQGDRLVISVRDDGAGISEGNRERIFDPFFTTRRAEGGAGMGLGIVRALMRAHGGDIALEPSEQGAAFAVMFAAPTPPQAPPASWRDVLARFGRAQN
jgi:signal transduction histidine kinase